MSLDMEGLRQRGLEVTRMITSNDHAGLRAARRTVFPNLPWQRCQFHLQQNAQAYETTLALALVGTDADETHPAYFNWDDPRSAAQIHRLEFPPAEPLLVLDEIHEYKRWRNLVKGIYDTERSRRRRGGTPSSGGRPVFTARCPAPLALGA